MVQLYGGIVKSGEKEGQEIWTSILYHSKLDNLVSSLHERLLRESSADTLILALKESEKIATMLKSALTPHFEMKEK